MIAFDNGPAHGDYVRYIDDLMKRAAVAATAGVLPEEPTSSAIARVRERIAAQAAVAAGPAPAPGSGFAPQNPATTAAAAVAAALMSGQTGRRTALATHVKVGVAAIAFGILLLLIGLLVSPVNVLLLAGGGATIAWAIRMMRDASARLSSTRT